MSTLRVGTGRANITPPLGSHIGGYFNDRLAEDILHELYAKAIVVEANGTTAAWVVCDQLMMERVNIDQAKHVAAAATGIPERHIMIAATHTHFAPETRRKRRAVPCNDDYLGWMPRKVADSIILAHRRLQPAEMGHASAQCPEQVFNRRYHMKDGSVKMNPGYQNPEIVKPAGPTDPEVPFVVFRSLEGEPIAVLANYALHYVGGPYNHSITADYFGAFDRHLSRMAGREHRAPEPASGDFMAVMGNGCCGDINNIDVSGPAPEYPYPFAKADAVAEMVAGRVWDAWGAIDRWDRAPRLAVAHEEVMFRRREVPEDQLQWARDVLAGRIEASHLDQIYAHGALAVDTLPIEQPTVLQAFALGDVGLATLPGEMFCQLGLDIKARSPLARTLVVELANDWLGYISDERAFDLGGYEVRTGGSARAERGMGEFMADHASRLLEQAGA